MVRSTRPDISYLVPAMYLRTLKFPNLCVVRKFLAVLEKTNTFFAVRNTKEIKIAPCCDGGCLHLYWKPLNFATGGGDSVSSSILTPNYSM